MAQASLYALVQRIIDEGEKGKCKLVKRRVPQFLLRFFIIFRPRMGYPHL